MTYELRHFDTPLMRFTATEDTSTPEIEILWVNEEKKALLPLDMNATSDSMDCQNGRVNCAPPASCSQARTTPLCR